MASLPSASGEPRPLRVLLVAPSLDTVGGQSTQANLIVSRMRAESAVDMAFQPVAPQLPGPLRPLQRMRFVRTLPTFALYCAQLHAALRYCDIAHVFSASYTSFVLAPTPAIRFARQLGRPLILNYHSGEAEDHLARWPSAVRMLRLASRLVVPSAYLVEVFARFGLSASVVPNAVELDTFRFRERTAPAPAFLVNRNFEAHYNVAGVLRAFARIQAQRPEATLTLAGDGPEGAALRALAVSLGLRHVHFAGRVRPVDMPALYEAHDFWLNGSDVDNMPISILEAFASGVAVVSTRPGGIPFLVDDGRTGRLVPCGDFQALAAAALGILEDPSLFARLTRAGREECARYTWPRVRQGWLDAYSQLAPQGTMLHRAET
jgi:glycosyltransferase involved in cell wall biosynthesis